MYRVPFDADSQNFYINFIFVPKIPIETIPNLSSIQTEALLLFLSILFGLIISSIVIGIFDTKVGA
ncbi:MAG: hypothetical protein QXP04_00285 [Candidatus Nanoarchaeia archaeon]|nr:hypothetical protein [Candidatus Jingweiarchaeum tengchongense]